MSDHPGKPVDIKAVNHGSLWLLFGETGAGEVWLKDNIDPEALTFGTGIVVEPRYVEDIIEGARESGLEVYIH